MGSVKLKSTELNERFNEYGAIVLKNGYLYDQENQAAINSCIEVLKKNEQGLMILGNPGSGKTLFFDIAQRIINPLSENFFSKANVLDVVLQFNNKEIGHLVFRNWQNKNILFDDLGTEDKGYLYGEKVEVFEKFIQFRYELFRLKKIKTHFSTNLSYEELKTRYGLRCVSRLNEMCSVVLLGANKEYTDRRKLKNFISLPEVYYEKPVDQEQLRIKNIYEKMKQNVSSQQPESNTSLGARMRKILGT